MNKRDGERTDQTGAPGFSGLRIAPLTGADTGELFALLRENTDYSRMSMGREAVVADCDAILRTRPQSMPPKAKQVLGFWEGETLAAVCDLLDGYPDAGALFIGLLMVRAARQGTGLGTAVLHYIAGYAAAQGRTRLRLAVIDANAGALRFWEKQGFIQTGGQTITGNHPARQVITMERKL